MFPLCCSVTGLKTVKFSCGSFMSVHQRIDPPPLHPILSHPSLSILGSSCFISPRFSLFSLLISIRACSLWWWELKHCSCSEQRCCVLLQKWCVSMRDVAAGAVSALQCYLVFCLQTVFQCLSACTHWTNPVCPCKCLSLWMCTHSAWLFPVFCWVTRILNHLYAQGGFQLVLHSRCFWCGKSRTVISLVLYLGSHKCFNNTLLPQWGKMLSNKIIA